MTCFRPARPTSGGREPARKAVRTTAYVAATALTVGLFATTTSASAAPTPPASAHPVGAPTVKKVTLVTGDVVQVSTSSDGKKSVTLAPRPDGTIPQAAINEAGGHLYVVPRRGLRPARREATRPRPLRRHRACSTQYDDASPATLPVIVDYGSGRHRRGRGGQGVPHGREADGDDPQAGRRRLRGGQEHRSRVLGRPHRGQRLRRAPDRSGRRREPRRPRRPGQGRPRGLGAADPRARGLGRRLHRRRRHGGRPRHRLRPDPPRPAGPGPRRRATSPPTPTVTDGNGHGTHVASTIAGSGAASDGLRKGVAPGADLHGRQGARRRRLRRGLLGARRHGVGRRTRAPTSSA